ncbi:hypothetical protein QEH59_15975 [Coraliomargarita sp. SDUM461004]|uniref:O-antigen ligase family protein n=1 Tax=Thalassobacterium sedimentorum TaxID=3041258 RepID=A0ABU1ANZ8_9BACT|nr:hypothetical protein [Coraliomargarita sp. SDUM461004]MDQ8195933.1 hypothetical protein [Coraliomargarita sp. SDUM461004]
MFIFIPIQQRKGFRLSYDVFLKLYLFWMLTCAIRGAFIASDYWQYKALIQNSFALTAGLCVWSFAQPEILNKVLRYWLLLALPLFIPLLFILYKGSSYGFYLSPVVIFILMLPALPRPLALLMLCLTVFCLFADIGARSTLIRFSVPLLLLVTYPLRQFIPKSLLKVAFLFCFITPILLAAFAATNGLNPFTAVSQAIAEEIDDAETRDVVTTDTRTGLYEEVVESAIKNDYVLIGRTPARGYDSKDFGIGISKIIGTTTIERSSCEVGILNIFTWTGVIGVVLYTLVFATASYLAVVHSNSWMTRTIGLYLAFRWTYSWIEEFNRFDIMQLSLWMLVAICMSPAFRAMSDADLKEWGAKLSPRIKWNR